MADVLSKAEQYLDSIKGQKYSSWLSVKTLAFFAVFVVILFLNRNNIPVAINGLTIITVAFLCTRCLHDCMIEYRKAIVRKALIETLGKDGDLSSDDAAIISRVE